MLCVDMSQGFRHCSERLSKVNHDFSESWNGTKKIQKTSQVESQDNTSWNKQHVTVQWQRLRRAGAEARVEVTSRELMSKGELPEWKMLHMASHGYVFSRHGFVKFLLLCRWLWISKMSISWAPQINDVTMELLAGDIRVIGSHLGSTSFCKGLLSHSNDFCWCQVRIYIVFINLYMIHGFMHFSLIHVFLHRIRHNF